MKTYEHCELCGRIISEGDRYCELCKNRLIVAGKSPTPDRLPPAIVSDPPAASGPPGHCLRRKKKPPNLSPKEPTENA